jgi:hypothetical protein
MSDHPKRTPQHLRDDWHTTSREHQKAVIMVDCMKSFTRVVDEAIITGDTKGMPDYGDPLLVSEALHDALRMFTGTERILAQLRTEAYDAFNKAAQQN